MTLTADSSTASGICRELADCTTGTTSAPVSAAAAGSRLTFVSAMFPASQHASSKEQTPQRQRVALPLQTRDLRLRLLRAGHEQRDHALWPVALGRFHVVFVDRASGLDPSDIFRDQPYLLRVGIRI